MYVYICMYIYNRLRSKMVIKLAAIVYHIMLYTTAISQLNIVRSAFGCNSYI
jgi:hypothetical protein